MSRSANAAPRPAFGVVTGRPEAFRDVLEPSVPQIAIHDLPLLVAGLGLETLDLRVDVAVDEEQVEPAVLVEIEEPDAPPEPPRVQADAARKRPVLAQPLPVVGVQRRRVAGEIGLEDVDGPVAIVITDRDAHAGLRFAVLAVGAARRDADVRERAVRVVQIQRAWIRVVGHVQIDPAVVVEIERADAEAVGALRAS